MTQRFGGLFSILSQRDYRDLIRISDEESFDRIYNFESMSRREILESIENIKADVNTRFSVYKEFQSDEDRLPRSNISEEEIDFITHVRTNLTTLNRI